MIFNEVLQDGKFVGALRVDDIITSDWQAQQSIGLDASLDERWLVLMSTFVLHCKLAGVEHFLVHSYISFTCSQYHLT